MKKITIILDAGHGVTTPGKCSPALPDGHRFYEWEYSRELSKRIKTVCDQLGIKCIQANTDETDPSLSVRAKHINDICAQEKKQGHQCLMISLHGNAAGDGGWFTARGWEVYTTEGRTNSDIFAEIMCETFKEVFPDQKLRGHKQKNFTVIYKTKCPCVLTENFFYDNQDDLKLIMSEEGLQKITDLHIKSICKYIEY